MSAVRALCGDRETTQQLTSSHRTSLILTITVASGCFRLARGGGPGGGVRSAFTAAHIHASSLEQLMPTATHDLANHCKWWSIIQTGSLSSVLERHVFKSDSLVTTQFGTAGCVCARRSQKPPKLLSSAVLLTPPRHLSHCYLCCFIFMFITLTTVFGLEGLPLQKVK